MTTKKILLCVTGLSPQIVTETVYALAHRTPAWLPDEVHLVTTARGADNARLRLLSEDPGWFLRLRRDYRLPEIRFDGSTIHVISDSAGMPLADIRDDGHNAHAADAIAQVVRALTLDAETELHASIAGGRKTMGYLLGAAMSLYGRRQDRMSHVLVTAPFETHPEFFYPSPTPRVINSLDRGGDALDCSTARVWLGDIPFVRLRHLLPDDLVKQDLSYAELVAMANRNLEGEDWTLWPERGIVQVGQYQASLSTTQTGLLMLFAACSSTDMRIRAPLPDHPDAEWPEMVMARLKRAGWQMRVPDAFVDWVAGAAMGGDFHRSFEQQLSRLSRRLRQALHLPNDPIDRREPGANHKKNRAYRLAVPPDRFALGRDHERPQRTRRRETQETT